MRDALDRARAARVIAIPKFISQIYLETGGAVAPRTITLFTVPAGMVYRIHALAAYDATNVATILLTLSNIAAGHVLYLETQRQNGIGIWDMVYFGVHASGLLPLDVPKGWMAQLRLYGGATIGDEMHAYLIYEVVEGAGA